jgi:uncharacterized protein YjbI with pentapeptide repeats
LAVFLAGAFLAGAFVAAVVFAAVLLAVDLLVVDLLVLDLLVVDLLAGAFFAVDVDGAFLAVVDFEAVVLAGAFFAVVVFDAVALAGAFFAVVDLAAVDFEAVDFDAVDFDAVVLLGAADFFDAAFAASDALGSLGIFLAPETNAFSSAPAVNFGTAVFFALILSPVRGLRTHRASRTRFSNEPKPVIATFSPLETSRVMVSRTASRACCACLRFPS